MPKAAWGNFRTESRIECSYCGGERLDSEMTRVKVSAGPDLYFCKGHPFDDSCAMKVARQLVEVIPARLQERD